MDKGRIPSTNIRPALYSSFWYQGDAELLREEIQEALLHSKKTPKLEKEPLLMVFPHSGLTYSKRALTHLLRYHPSVIKRVVLLSPSHYVPLHPNSIYQSNFDGYDTPLGILPHLDLKLDHFTHIDNEPFLREHAVEMILPILAYKQFEQQQHIHTEMFLINHIDSQETTQSIATSLLHALRKEDFSLCETLIIASSDFTHYGKRFNHTPFEGKDSVDTLIEDADMVIINQLINGIHTQKTTYPATPCGYAAMSIVSEMAHQLSLQGKLIDYYTSKQIMQSDDSVSYATIFFSRRHDG